MSRGASRKRDSLRNLNTADVDLRWFDLERSLEPVRPNGDVEPGAREQAEDQPLDEGSVDRGDGS